MNEIYSLFIASLNETLFFRSVGFSQPSWASLPLCCNKSNKSNINSKEIYTFKLPVFFKTLLLSVDLWKMSELE